MRPWGRIIAAASLLPLAACTGEKAAVDYPRPEGERPPPRVPELVTPTTSSTIGDLVPLEKLDTPLASQPRVLSARTSKFGVAVLDYPAAACPIAPTSCALMARRAHDKPIDPLDPTEPSHGVFGGFEAAPQRWTELSPGKDVVYAVRAESLDVDTIAADGKVTPLIHLDEEPLRRAKVAELSDGYALVGEDVRTGRLRVMRFDKKGAKVSETPLGTNVIQPRRGRMSAQAARTAGPGSVWAPFAIVPELDDAGAPTSRFAIVAVVVTPPGPRDPSGKSWRGPPPKGKAKNGCGGPASRRLSDASVKKELVVLRPEGAEVNRQTFDWPDTADQDAHPFVAMPQKGGLVQVDDRLIARDGSKREVAAPTSVWSPSIAVPKLSTTRARADVVAFEGGEALVCLHDHERKAIIATEKTEIRGTTKVRDCSYAARTAAGWLVGGSYGLELLAPNETRNLTPVEGERVLGIVRTKEGVLVVAGSDADLRIYGFDEQKGTLTKKRTAPRPPDLWSTQVVPWMGGFAVIEHDYRRLVVNPDGGEPMVLDKSESVREVLPVFGDTVVLSDKDGVATAMWLSSSERRPVGRVTAAGAFDSSSRWETVLIPDTPGVGPLDAGRLTRARCGRGFPLAAGERLFACVEGRQLDSTDTWLGLRRVSWKMPPAPAAR